MIAVGILSAIVLACFSFMAGVGANDEAASAGYRNRAFLGWCLLALFLASLAAGQVAIAVRT